MNLVLKPRKLKPGHWITLILVLAIACILSIISSVNEVKFTLSGERYREEKVNTIIKALQAEDIKPILNLFSKVAIDEAGEDELEDGIRYLFTILVGNVKSVKVQGSDYSESIRGLQRVKYSTVSGLVTTDVGVYRVYGPDTIYDSFNRRNVGISQLMVQTIEDLNKYGYPADDFYGVFRQDIVAAAVDRYSPDENSIDRVLNALQKNSIESLVGMFSQKAILEVGAEKIKNGSKYSCDVIKEKIDSWDSSNANIESNIKGGKVQMVLYMLCYVYTKDTTYTVYYREYLIDEIYPDNVGIDRLLVKESDNVGGRWLLKDAIGIFCPKEDDPKINTSWKPE